MEWKRILPSLGLLCLGAGMLVYGTVFHVVTIFEEEETELSIPIPAPFPPPMSFGDHAEDPFDRDFHASGGGAYGAIDPFSSGGPLDHASVDEAVNPFEQGAGSPEAIEENPFAAQPEPSDDLPPDEAPWFPAPHGMLFDKVIRIELVPRIEPGWVLVREVTFGGVARLDNGTLKRTYSGKPPALCPT